MRVLSLLISAGNGVIHAINKVLSGGPTSVVADFTTGAFSNAVVTHRDRNLYVPIRRGAMGLLTMQISTRYRSRRRLNYVHSIGSGTTASPIQYQPYPNVDPAYDPSKC